MLFCLVVCCILGWVVVDCVDVLAWFWLFLFANLICSACFFLFVFCGFGCFLWLGWLLRYGVRFSLLFEFYAICFLI